MLSVYPRPCLSLTLRNAVQVELNSLGGAKTVPYLVMFLMSNVGGWAGDWLILKRRNSTGTARKIVNTLGEGWRVEGGGGPAAEGAGGWGPQQ